MGGNVTWSGLRKKNVRQYFFCLLVLVLSTQSKCHNLALLIKRFHWFQRKKTDIKSLSSGCGFAAVLFCVVVAGMSERIELEDIPKQTGDSLEYNSTDDRAVTGNENGDHLAHNTQERPEEMSLLDGEDIVRPLPQHAEDNSVVVNDHHQATDERKCVTRRVWEELKKPIVWNLRLWMVLAITFGVIFLVIVLSLVFCSVLYEDEDEKFNKGSFVVPRLYTGTVRLVNQNFTVDQLKNGSSQMQDLSSQLQKMLADLYTSSPALGRYFSSARVSNFSEGSVTAHYWLRFVVPEEHGELVRYTLSTQMVRGILRQHLYEPQPWAPLYIDPETVRVTVGNNTQN